MKNNNVLYCGMADDILSPLILVPDLTHLYVMDRFDLAFAKNYTIEGQINDIKEMLSIGSDENSYHIEIYRKYKPKWPITKLDESCTIINETLIDNCWRLTFTYKNLKRELVYFQYKDFYSIWPEEIKNINHFMSMGAVCIKDKGETNVQEPTFWKMINERIESGCVFYDGYNSFWHNKENYNKLINVRNSDIMIMDYEQATKEY